VRGHRGVDGGCADPAADVAVGVEREREGSGSGDGGGGPPSTQRSRCAIAERSTKVWGPVLMGEAQVKSPIWLVGFRIESNHAATDGRGPVSVSAVWRP
jgi:hypothetical protein